LSESNTGQDRRISISRSTADGEERMLDAGSWNIRTESGDVAEYS